MVQDNKDTNKPKKPRKTSAYNVYRSYLKRRGTHLSLQDLSASWTLANKDKVENDKTIRHSFSSELDKIKKRLTTKHTNTKGEEIINKPDRLDVLDALVASNFTKQFDTEFADYLKQSGRGEQVSAEMARGEYKTTDGKAGSIPSGSDPKGDGSGPGPVGLGKLMKDALPGTGAGTGTKNTEFGNLNPLTGNFVRPGEQLNAGGGVVDTQVGADADLGDKISLGPRSVQTAKKTLRPKQPIAGEESVKATAVEEAKSNVIFESFSIVPPGHGLGPENTLEKMNQANDFIRFGIEPLAYPRANDPDNGIKDEVRKWSENQPKPMIVDEMKQDEEKVTTATKEVVRQIHQPDSIIEDGPDMQREPSSQTLPRPRATPYTTIYNNKRLFLPSTTPCGLFLSNVPYKPIGGMSGCRGEI